MALTCLIWDDDALGQYVDMFVALRRIRTNVTIRIHWNASNRYSQSNDRGYYEELDQATVSEPDLDVYLFSDNDVEPFIRSSGAKVDVAFLDDWFESELLQHYGSERLAKSLRSRNAAAEIYICTQANLSDADVAEGTRGGHVTAWLNKGRFTEPECAKDWASRLNSFLERRTVTEARREEAAQVGEPLESFRLTCERCPKMTMVFNAILRVASSRLSVLILGESGTGKELVAQAVHYASERAPKPLVAVNCSIFTEALLASELFGHVKGAFSGADSDKVGLFRAADGGTLFGDEIGEMAMDLQPKLLRVLENGSFRRVGSNEEERVDVRLVTATNDNLANALTDGRFREDLYHRVNGAAIVLPPFRERSVEHRREVALQLLLRMRPTDTGCAQRFTDDALSAMMRYQWPGNVRELKNAIEYAVHVCTGEEIQRSDFEAKIASSTLRWEETTTSMAGAVVGITDRFGGNPTDRLSLLQRINYEVARRALEYVAARLNGASREKLRTLGKNDSCAANAVCLLIVAKMWGAGETETIAAVRRIFKSDSDAPHRAIQRRLKNLFDRRPDDTPNQRDIAKVATLFWDWLIDEAARRHEPLSWPGA